MLVSRCLAVAAGEDSALRADDGRRKRRTSERHSRLHLTGFLGKRRDPDELRAAVLVDAYRVEQ